MTVVPADGAADSQADEPGTEEPAGDDGGGSDGTDPGEVDPGDNDPGYNPDPDQPGSYDPDDPAPNPNDDDPTYPTPDDPNGNPNDPGSDDPGPATPTPSVWCAGLSGGWWYYRTSACSVETITQTVYDDDLKPVASITYLVAREITSHYDLVDWDQRTEFHFLSGELNYEQIDIDPQLSCSNHWCDVTGGAEPVVNAAGMKLDNPTVIEHGVQSQTDFAATGVDVVENEATTFSLSVAYPYPVYIPGNAYVDQETSLRCDNTARADRFPGCVFTASTPTVSMTRYGEASKHIHDAQAAGAPGAVFGTPLTRTTDEATKSRNREAACPDNFPKAEGQDCDEYPFASTYQGGASGGTYSARAINSRDNRAAGARLGNFFGDERVLDRDAFYVQADGDWMCDYPDEYPDWGCTQTI